MDRVIDLWLAAAIWANDAFAWQNTPFKELDTTTMEPRVLVLLDKVSGTARQLALTQDRIPADVAVQLRDRISEFRQHVPLFLRLGHVGMKAHHWRSISAASGLQRTSPCLSYVFCGEGG